MPDTLRVWWTALTGAQRTLHTALGIGGTLAAGWLLLSGFISLPAQVAEIDARSLVNSTAISEIRAARQMDRTLLEFVACGQEARIRGYPETDCLSYLTRLQSNHQPASGGQPHPEAAEGR